MKQRCALKERALKISISDEIDWGTSYQEKPHLLTLAHKKQFMRIAENVMEEFDVVSDQIEVIKMRAARLVNETLRVFVTVIFAHKSKEKNDEVQKLEVTALIHSGPAPEWRLNHDEIRNVPRELKKELGKQVDYRFQVNELFNSWWTKTRERVNTPKNQSRVA